VLVVNLLAYWQVLKAQRTVVIVGTAVAVLLAAMALVHVSPSGVAYRSPPTYVATTTMFVTQPGFPWGRTVLNEYLKAQGGGPNAAPVPKYADPGRLAYLAGLYARLAGGDGVKKIVDPTGKKSLRYQVDQVTTSDGSPFPLINVSAFAGSGPAAVSLANRVSAALQTYVARNQTLGNVPEATRVSLPFVHRAERAKVFEGVKYTAPLMLFVLGMAVTIFVAFVRHNVQLGRAAQLGDAQALLVAVPPVEASAVGDESADARRPRPVVPPTVRPEAAAPRADEAPVPAEGKTGAGAPRVRGGTLRMDQPNAAGRTP